MLSSGLRHLEPGAGEALPGGHEDGQGGRDDRLSGQPRIPAPAPSPGAGPGSRPARTCGQGPRPPPRPRTPRPAPLSSASRDNGWKCVPVERPAFDLNGCAVRGFGGQDDRGHTDQRGGDQPHHAEPGGRRCRRPARPGPRPAPSGASRSASNWTARKWPRPRHPLAKSPCSAPRSAMVNQGWRTRSAR